jgi:hypothetical protein
MQLFSEGMQTQPRTKERMILGVLVAVVSLLSAAAFPALAAKQVIANPPSHVEHIEGSELSLVTLTPRAMERLGLETIHATEEEMSGSTYTVVPYSSIIYDTKGRTWVYTSPKPGTFVRAQIVVKQITGDKIYLSDGPPAGTVVASVAVAELYGTEFTVGH